MIMKRRTLKRAAALTLACLVLTACGGKQGGGVEGSGASVSASASAAGSEEPVDYSKYNTYLQLSEDIYEIEDVLMTYFSNVEYQEDFALTEGGDYANIKEALEWYTPISFTAQKALEYADEDPAYPDADQAVKSLGTSVEEVMDALNAIGSYVRFDDYEKDALAQAPQLHADLWSACQTYDLYYADFLTAVDVMASQDREEDEARLLEDGEMILYHSTCMIHASQDILDDIWNQIMESAAEEEGEFVLPAIDMTGLSPLFGKFQTAYEGLTQAMDTSEEMEKVFTGKLADQSSELYKKKVDGLFVKMGELAQVLLDGGDYADAYDAVSEAANSMIDGYNSIIN